MRKIPKSRLRARERRQREDELRQEHLAKSEPRQLDPMMEPLRDYLLAKPGCEECFPFGPEAMVFKVADKMFGLLAWEEIPVYVSLKCDPEHSLELREEHAGINGAYHMNKKHWHSVAMDGSVELELAQRLIDRSYELVTATLPGRVRERLQQLSQD